ncbi:MAG: hypothetical protein Q7V20_20020 [Aquabacterium sp.]|uniref:hypothetical protein n=1 Tax=Aquabacterium sp. TaxID=1872578 RepID=UPI00271F40C9|nr:hypothetical protein [Aquabacterium sp.]MDO9005738.1 hypothetical protein [Aquabacterium sp.]
MAHDQTGERKAALLLHSLPGPARQEVLARLDDARRDTLVSLLDELQALGIPTGHAWVDLNSSAGDAGPHQAVWNLGSAQATALLAGQSLETVAGVLGLAAWPWAAELLSQWPAEQRSQLKSLAASPRAMPTPVAESLLLSLADKARHAGIKPGVPLAAKRPVRPSWLQRLLRSSAP